MKNFDLSKFKKVKSDAKCTTLKHPDGHEIKIAHGPLSKKMRSDLDKLPHEEPKKYAAGGAVEKGEESEVVNDPEDLRQKIVDQATERLINPSGSSYDDIVARNKFSQAEKQANSTADAAISDAQHKDQYDYSMAKQKEYVDASSAGKSFADIPVTPQATTLAPSPVAATADQSQPQPEAPVAAPSPAATMQAQASPVAQPQAPAAPATPPAPSTPQEFTSEDKAWQQDLDNGHIKPETYSDLFAKKSTLGKIGTIFGLLIGGAGSGLSHQPDALSAMMDREIQNDFEAQKQSKQNAMNFRKLNYDHQLQIAQVGATNAQTKATLAEAGIRADALSRMQMNRAAFHQIVQSVNKLPVGSPERANAEQTLGMLSQQIDLQNANLADMAAGKLAFAKMLFGSPTGASNEQQFQKQTTGLRMLGPQGEARAKDMEEKHFPGLRGQASVPLGGEDRASINSGIEFDQKLRRFINWTKSHSGDVSPSDRHEGEALAAELQGSYRQATHGGVYKEGENNFISKFIDSEPTKFFNSIRVVPQLEAISRENKARVNQLVKSKGFSGYEGQADGPQIKIVNGVKYTRGPNGQAVRVK